MTPHPPGKEWREGLQQQYHRGRQGRYRFLLLVERLRAYLACFSMPIGESRAYAKEVASKEIQAILRHTQLSITMDLYTHILAETRHDAADAMDAALQSLPVTGGRITQKTGS